MNFYLPQKVFDSIQHWLSFLIATILFFLTLSSANAYDVVLAWDPNTEPDLSGYILYVDDGTSNLPYEHFATYPLEVIDPNNPVITITGLQDDLDYYFVMTAYDTQGNESDYSEEICVMNGQQCPENLAATNNSVPEDAGASISNSVEGDGGGGGGGCFIATSSFRTNTQRTPNSWFSSAFLFFILMVGIAAFKKKWPLSSKHNCLPF